MAGVTNREFWDFRVKTRAQFTKLAEQIANIDTSGGGGISELTSKMVVDALGYTPYNANNPANYITSAALAPYLKTEDAKETYATKDFVNNKLINYATIGSVTAIQNTLTGQIGAVGASVEQLAATKLDSSYFTLTNIKSTLGISDWALAATKPAYTAAEVGALSLSGGTVNGILSVASVLRMSDVDGIYKIILQRDSSGNILFGGGFAANNMYIDADVLRIKANETKFSQKVTAPSFIGNLTGNADSATKLQAPRTLWGQSFDGTKNISGAITLANNQSINVTFTDGTIKNALLLASSNNNLYLGYGTALSGASTFLWGKEIQFVNSSGQPIATFKDDKLGIGTNSPNVLLTVNGELRAAASIYLHNTNEINSFQGKLYLNHRGSGQTGYGSTNDIVMVGHGGNVGIGNTSPTERLDVSGNIKADGNINATSITINGVTITASNGSITVNGNVIATGSITQLGSN